MSLLPITGGGTRWLLKVGVNPGALQGGSGEQYFTGWFDGRRFVNDNPSSTTLWTDYGKDCYCALPFSGRRPGEPAIVMGWMNNWQYAGKVPTQPWRGQMTVPRRSWLRRFPEGLRLMQEPVEDIERLRGEEFRWEGDSVAALNAVLRAKRIQGQTFELRTTIAPAEGVSWHVLAGQGAWTEIGYDGRELFVDRTHSGITNFSPDFPARTAAPLPLGGEPLRLTIVVDRSSVEVFAQGGRVAMTNLVYPPAGAQGIELRAGGSQGVRIAVEYWPLRL